MEAPIKELSECEKYVSGSKTLLSALILSGKYVPEEMQRVQELVECLDNNAKRITKALAANRRRPADSAGADITAQLLKEQKQYISQILELYEKLSSKPSPMSTQANP